MRKSRVRLSNILLLVFLSNADFVKAQLSESDIEASIAKSYSLVLSGGILWANANGGSQSYPLYIKNMGGTISSQLRYQLSEKVGAELHFAYHFFPADAEKTATEILHSEPTAQSISLHMRTIRANQFGVGAYRAFQLGKKIRLMATPRIGVSVLHTPEITANLTTEPFSELVYGAGRNSALFFSMNLNAAYRICRDIDFEWGIGYDHATHRIGITSTPNPDFHENWAYNLVNMKVGLAYKLF